MAPAAPLRFAALFASAALVVGGAAATSAQGLATQGSASAQPVLPRPMPGFTVPGGPEVGTKAKSNVRPAQTAQHGRRHARSLGRSEPIDRPALANVELLEPLPRPPQPPHVTVPTPGYPLDDFVTAFTTPPPPVVCRPTAYDRFKPDLRLVDERPVLCTADNP